MVVRLLNPKKDPFYHKEDDKEILGLEVPYLNTIRALLYFVQWTRPDIAFSGCYWQDLALHLLEDVGMTLNTFSVIFVE